MQILTGAVPIMIMGFIACACILENAQWKGERNSMSISQLWDSSEESKQEQAITIAEHIDHDAVNAATPPPIDPEIMKEVRSASRSAPLYSGHRPDFGWYGLRLKRQKQSRPKNQKLRRPLLRYVFALLFVS